MGLTDEQRQAVVAEAESWYGTPYRDCSACKGKAGGIDCGQFLKAVFQGAGVKPKDGIPTPTVYSTQIWLHKDDTTYIDILSTYMREIPESEVKAGDVVLFKQGRGWSHAAIVKDYPKHVIHVTNKDGVCAGDVSSETNAKYGKMPKKFWTVKDEVTQ